MITVKFALNCREVTRQRHWQLELHRSETDWNFKFVALALAVTHIGELLERRPVDDPDMAKVAGGDDIL